MQEQPRRQSRIQRKNRETILTAALREFSARGFAGTTIDQIAEAAGLSKPNVLYYFQSKDAIHTELLRGLMDLWLGPLRDMRAEGDPADQILAYARRKLEMSRDYPQESRLFANEVLQGAPRLQPILGGELRELVEEKSALIALWIAEGRIAPVDPHHLLFSIWALTQHYADFEVQVRAVLGPDHDPYAEAEVFLDQLYRRMLRVQPRE
ncbi:MULTISPECIES: TetR family transcriptional regulator C-terminal domain-containing protein [Paracoccus]|jgi:TetR/AcrR family transcriptional regulator|uniref:TetR family transcriptional regulator n=1 Tax=Paracoccus litorisediminis TaxID=2006130 RepID=A0A844HP31_9RHOB|nr:MULTISPECIES: TetR family transcriptional regulator C-terminal domain-containing protein [Paracoccus]MBD9527920.1 TetR family transcriptional regulator C-terminal domain-containing protein [Paracoccus sp. PAR01]MTH59915.1 TetR family transcriptional regulator [Paracoccus litorisediminis]